WNRILTHFAGPMNNFILGIIVFSLLAFMQGGVASNDNVLGDIQPGSPAEEAGLTQGDRVVAIDDQAVGTWQEMVVLIQQHPNEEIALTVEAPEGGDTKEISITPNEATTEQGESYGQIGVYQPFDQSFQAKVTFGFTQTWFIITSIFSLIGS